MFCAKRKTQNAQRKTATRWTMNESNGTCDGDSVNGLLAMLNVMDGIARIVRKKKMPKTVSRRSFLICRREERKCQNARMKVEERTCKLLQHREIEHRSETVCFEPRVVEVAHGVLPDDVPCVRKECDASRFSKSFALVHGSHTEERKVPSSA